MAAAKCTKVCKSNRALEEVEAELHPGARKDLVGQVASVLRVLWENKCGSLLLRKLRVQTAAARQRGCWDSRSRSSVGSGGRMRRRAVVRFRDPTMPSDQAFPEDHT